jgi:hypothetical protein
MKCTKKNYINSIIKGERDEKLWFLDLMIGFT